jgi:hypothetical protein
MKTISDYQLETGFEVSTFVQRCNLAGKITKEFHLHVTDSLSRLSGFKFKTTGKNEDEVREKLKEWINAN